MSNITKNNKKLSLIVQPASDEPDPTESITNIEALITSCIADMIASIPPENLTKDPKKFDELAHVTAVLVREVEKYVRSKHEAAQLAQAKERRALKKLSKNSPSTPSMIASASDNIKMDGEKTAKKTKKLPGQNQTLVKNQPNQTSRKRPTNITEK